MAGCIAGMIVLPFTAIWAMTGIIGHIFRTLLEMIELSIKLFEITLEFICYLCEKYQKLKRRSNHD